MTILYCINPSHSTKPEIQRIDVVHETKHTATIVLANGHHRVMYKQGTLFPTWKLAHEELLRRADKELSLARRRLERAKDFDGNVKGMRDPEVQA